MEANNVNNTKKNTAGSKINAYQICLVALAVGINIAGGQIALLLKLPVYLDSIGTILTGALLGPWFGMLPNLISGIFMGMTVDIYSLYFAPVGMITVPGTVVSSVINAVLFGGVTSSGSSILVQLLSHTPLGLTGSIFVVQFLTDYLDRCIAVFVVSVFVTMLSGEMKQRLTGSVNNRA